VECDLEYFDPIKEGPVKGPLERLEDTLIWLAKEKEKTAVALEKTENLYYNAKERHKKDYETLNELIKLYREAIEQLSN
jgi:hypothetical protein